MKDSYQDFIDRFGIDKQSFYQFGLQSIISADVVTAEAQYQQVKEKLLNNAKLVIRSYGGKGVHSNLYLDLYRYLFGNNNLGIDPTNNSAPRRNISAATGYRINKNLLNYQVSHIWGKTKNPILFESVWNICFVPRLYDPFTGHEASGGWNEEFIPLLNHFVFDKFEALISDYNQFVVENNIQSKINAFVDTLLSNARHSTELISRFRYDALNEWSLLKRI